MARVAAFEIGGIDCWFYAQDHRPPHFHARRKGEWEFRVFFLMPKKSMLEQVGGGRMKRRDRNDLCDMAELYREELFAEWEVVCGD